MRLHHHSPLQETGAKYAWVLDISDILHLPFILVFCPEPGSHWLGFHNLVLDGQQRYHFQCQQKILSSSIVCETRAWTSKRLSFARKAQILFRCKAQVLSTGSPCVDSTFLLTRILHGGTTSHRLPLASQYTVAGRVPLSVVHLISRSAASVAKGLPLSL